MSDELRRGEAHVRTAVADLVDDIELPPAPGAHAPGRVPRSRRPAIVAIAAAVVVVLAFLVAIFGVRPVMAPVPARSGTLMPRELPDYRMWRTPQSWSPLGRVAMAWFFPQDEDFPPLDLGHEILIGADLAADRHLDGAGRAVVSPDGRRLMYGVDDEGILRLDDLAARRTVDVHVPGAGPIDDPVGHRVVPLDWSTDGQRAYVRVFGQPAVWEVTPEGAVARVPAAEGDPALIDFETERLSASPDGNRLALFGYESDVRIVDRRAAARPAKNPLAGVRGDAVWTPSGASLVVIINDAPPGAKAAVAIVDAATSKVRTRSFDHACVPLVMLTERRLLCRSSAATEPNVPASEAPGGLVTLDIETGEQRVVALGGSLVDFDVADDLARTWSFSMNEPWYPTVPDHE